MSKVGRFKCPYCGETMYTSCTGRNKYRQDPNGEYHLHSYHYRVCKKCGYTIKKIYLDDRLKETKCTRLPDMSKVNKPGVVINLKVGHGYSQDVWDKYGTLNVSEIINNEDNNPYKIREIKLEDFDDFGGN